MNSPAGEGQKPNPGPDQLGSARRGIRRTERRLFRVEFFPGTGVIVLQQVPDLASGTLQTTKDGQWNPSQCLLDGTGMLFSKHGKKHRGLEEVLFRFAPSICP